MSISIFKTKSAVLLVSFSLGLGLFSTISAPISIADSTNHLGDQGQEKIPTISVVTDSVIITFDGNQKDPKSSATSAVSEAAEKSNLEISKVSPINDTMVTVTFSENLSNSEIGEVKKSVEKESGVKALDANGILSPQSTNDSYYSSLWNLNISGSDYGVNAESIWPKSTGSGVIVGVVDTGLTKHSDLSGSSSSLTGGNVVPGYDFISDTSVSADGTGRDSDPSDPGDNSGFGSSWHGTHVSGIIAALKNNNKGVVGVAPEAKIEPLRALGKGGGYDSDIIAAILWGSGNSVVGIPNNSRPVNILNLSLGGSGDCSVALQTAINAANAKNVAVVVAAGNNSENLSNSSPANCANVIRVTASRRDGKLASYSNYGSLSNPATIAAPGGDGSVHGVWGYIASTYNDGETGPGKEAYIGMAGTSMATPHVSAILALLESIDPKLSLSNEIWLLQKNVTGIYGGCAVEKCGPGIANANKAVNSLLTLRQRVESLSATISGTNNGAGSIFKVSPNVSSPISLSYQWTANGINVSAGNGSTYVTKTSDSGKAISVRVSATFGYKTKTSTLGSIYLANIKKPTFTGSSTVGNKLTGAPGTWNVAPTSYSYKWLRNGAAISGAISPSYLLTSADRKKKISFSVTASVPGKTVTVISSEKTVATGSFKKILSPSISGSQFVGKTLTANPGKWTPNPIFKYQWKRSGKTIKHATKSIYKLTKSDRKKKISVKVTISASGYTTISSNSPGKTIK